MDAAVWDSPVDAAVLAALPAEIRTHFPAAFAMRRRTVWDARRLLAGWRGRWLTCRLDNGQYANARIRAIYDDVVHTPRSGFGLVVRGVSPGGEPAPPRAVPSERRRMRVTLPLTLLRDLPPDFEFLREPAACWPLPPAFVPCPAPSCGFPAVSGRFCSTCGRLARRGGRRAGHGEAFPVVQQLLRALVEEDPASVVACGCGALLHCMERYCTKCGRGAQTPR